MSNDKIIIAGAGCALADFLYNGVSFQSPAFNKFLSMNSGDGGLSPGRLVFTEELEKFARRPYSEIIHEIIGERPPDAFNVGGPSLVSLIHAAQLLGRPKYAVKFFGMAGNDHTADRIFEMVGQTPLNTEHYLKTSKKPTPFTDVLSDPDYDSGHGERTFINNIGAAWDYSPEKLSRDFFDSHITCFGGTALVPGLHDNLTQLLVKAREKDSITVVNTVYDFRNEKINPQQPWQLVRHKSDFGLIDLLIMDREEAFRISGTNTTGTAVDFFASSGVSSFIITNGAEEITAWSGGRLFLHTGLLKLPVSAMVTEDLKSNRRRKGDTTGCGDNFAGGIIASLAWQLKAQHKGKFSLVEALSWGIASGGYCCFTVGGTYLENSPGEKKNDIQHIQQNYLKQIGY